MSDAATLNRYAMALELQIQGLTAQLEIWRNGTNGRTRRPAEQIDLAETRLRELRGLLKLLRILARHPEEVRAIVTMGDANAAGQ